MPRTIDYLGSGDLTIDDYLDQHRPSHQPCQHGIPIDPRLRAMFDCTPNSERDPQEVQDWEGLPYIVTVKHDDTAFLATYPEGVRYDVRCLDGGCWDRSSSHGMFASFDTALDHAVKLRDAPQQWQVRDMQGSVRYTGTSAACHRWLEANAGAEAAFALIPLPDANGSGL